MTQKASQSQLPDWWQREKQRRLVRVLLFLLFVFALVAYFYYLSASGLTGIGSGVNFDSKNYIAFVRDDGKGHTDLYVVRADGTGERRLTEPGDNSTKSQPVWTLDGKSVIYAANLEDNRITQIYILGDGKPTQLTYGTGNKSCPAVSPDGQHAAFISQGAVKSVLMNGNDVYQLMPQPRSSNESSDTAPSTAELTGPFLSAAFSSDGTGVAGAQDLTDEAGSEIGDRSGVDMAITAIPPGGGTSVTLCTGHEVSMSWEKAGSRLACSFTELHAPNAPEKMGADQTPSYRDWQSLTGNSKNTTLVSAIQIFSFTPQGPKGKTVFTGLGYSIEPKNIAWSPDGSRMAFEGWRLRGDGQRELSGIAVQKLDADGSGEGVRVDPMHLGDLRYLVDASKGKPQNPKWSADSKHLLYEVVGPEGKRDLWTINEDGTNAINLTKGTGDNFDGAWSPAK